MKKLVVDDNGKITLDGVFITKEQFTSDFLIQIFNDKMNNNITFKLSDNASISQIFRSIEESLSEDNPFLEQYKEAKQKAEKYKKELEQLKTIENDSDKIE